MPPQRGPPKKEQRIKTVPVGFVAHPKTGEPVPIYYREKTDEFLNNKRTGKPLESPAVQVHAHGRRMYDREFILATVKAYKTNNERHEWQEYKRKFRGKGQSTESGKNQNWQNFYNLVNRIRAAELGHKAIKPVNNFLEIHTEHILEMAARDPETRIRLFGLDLRLYKAIKKYYEEHRKPPTVSILVGLTKKSANWIAQSLLITESNMIHTGRSVKPIKTGLTSRQREKWHW